MSMRFPSEIDDQFVRATQVLQRLAGEKRYAVAVSSCYAGAGTSSVATSLVRALAKLASDSVCLVEANVRSPGMAAAYQLRESPGFVDFLNDACTLDAALQLPPGESYHVMTAGGLDGKHQGFSHAQLARAADALRKRFDIVIVDTAPLLDYSDTAALVSHLDGLILVLDAERDSVETAQLAVKTAAEAGAKTLAAVLNKKPLYIPEWLYERL